eukprot:gene505-23935_t
MAEQDSGLTEQLEFYFGDANLRRDRFLRAEIEGSEDGFVQITVLQTFNKLKAAGVTVDEIAAAAKESTQLELDSSTSTKIKRVLPLPPKRSEETDCTIYVERLPSSTTHASLKAMFAKYGAVLFVSLPRHLPPSRVVGIKGFAFVEFGVAEHADAAVAALEPSITSKTAVRAMPKKEWDRLKEEYKALQRRGRAGKRPAAAAQSERRYGGGHAHGSAGPSRGIPKARSASSEPPQKRSRHGSGGAATSEGGHKKSALLAMPGVLVAVSNVPNAGTRTSIKATFEAFGCTPAYVDFKKGKTNATVRFNDAGSATKAVNSCSAALREGAAAATESMLGARLLEGAGEKEYWEGIGATGIAALASSSSSVSSPPPPSSASSARGDKAKAVAAAGDEDRGGSASSAAGKRRRKSGKLKAQRTHITFDN